MIKPDIGRELGFLTTPPAFEAPISGLTVGMWL